MNLHEMIFKHYGGNTPKKGSLLVSTKGSVPRPVGILLYEGMALRSVGTIPSTVIYRDTLLRISEITFKRSVFGVKTIIHSRGEHW